MFWKPNVKKMGDSIGVVLEIKSAVDLRRLHALTDLPLAGNGEYAAATAEL